MKKLIIAIFIVANINVFGQQMTQAQIDSIVKISNASESIPPTFMGTNTILVVFKYSKKSINKDLEKNLENEYKGEYKILEMGEALNPRDTSKVRFLVMVFDRYSSGYSTDIGRVKSETEYQITMTDRKTGKLYYYKEKSSCYTCVFKDYFKKLENLRAKL
jgi:hypothetical protein